MMRMESVQFCGKTALLHRCDTLIIGSGCAAWNAADCLVNLGRTDLLLVTEGVKMGTSRNTGSDKQTYYKLALQSGEPDSVSLMADALASGRSVNGDTAFAEAANSMRCFMKLVELGVPFPTNGFGEYVGYQTDHTTTKRATSAGPLTSKYMTEALEKSVLGKNVPILDGVTVVELLHDENGILGAVGIQRLVLPGMEPQIHVMLANHVICATGGPAAVYQNTVYPPSQTGMTGMLVDCGVECANLQEWQYGIASVKFRWNLSGTYQQVLPAYISVDSDGVRREFLTQYFDDPAQALSLVFLKGYQWPFDYAKLDGSSLIDLLVYHEEMELGRTVYLDYRVNPSGLEKGFKSLQREAYEYLRQSDALFGTPIERLNKMNPAAVELYLSHGIDLWKEPLQITVAAQHNNGGAAVDRDWQTNVPGLYVAGEAAGTFGVYRPGGSALNATQVGSLRAAEHISCSGRKNKVSEENLEQYAPICKRFFGGKESLVREDSGCILDQIRKEAPRKMSECGAHVRDLSGLRKLCADGEGFIDKLWDIGRTLPDDKVVRWFKTRDLLIAQQAIVCSMLYAGAQIGNRGGSVFCDRSVFAANNLVQSLKDLKQPENRKFDDQILYYADKKCCFRSARPMPQETNWFETVWAAYRQRNNRRIAYNTIEETAEEASRANYDAT